MQRLLPQLRVMPIKQAVLLLLLLLGLTASFDEVDAQDGSG